MRRFACAFAFTFALIVASSSQAFAAGWLPNKPAADKIAWQVFAQMMAPAATGVAFENWASDSDLYGSNPPQWPVANAPKLLQKSVGGAVSAPRAHALFVPSPDACAKPQDGAAGNFPPGACIGEEVRHNRAVFDYLARNNLTSVAGLAKAFSGPAIALPAGSVIAKADWVSLDDIVKWLPGQYKTPDDVRRAYYTNAATLNGETTEYALVGVSIQSKQIPDWIWTTFEHRGNPGRCDIIGCRDAFGADAADVAPASSPNSDYGACAKTPALAALFAANRLAAVWNNYCLKGTQVRYVDAAKSPTRLGNSVIERMNHGIPIAHISCITCHAYAAFDSTGHANGAILQKAPIGAFDPKLLGGNKQSDFVWGVLLAR
jgi:hypothetical protein